MHKSLRSFESTEQRLIKQSEHTLSYDMQVKEMELLKFSRKLTEKEKSERKGPVHYVAQNEVLRPEKKSTPIRIVKVKNDHRSKFPNLSNWKEEA